MPSRYNLAISIYIQAVIACIVLLIPLSSYALGVQEIELQSALNQPLNAKVGLNLTKGQKIYDIKAKLADPEVFEKSGLERPYFLTRIKFEPKLASDGTAYIHITSKEIVREPYLSFLVEINWQGGRFLKEFTVLLDPVTIQKPTSSQNDYPNGQRSAADLLKNAKLYGPVQEAETLWVIAQNNRPSPSVPIRKVMNDIYLANPNAFIRGDINLLKRGATLKIPQGNSVVAMTSETGAIPVSEPEQEQHKSVSETVETTSGVKSSPEPISKPSTPPQVANSPEATEPVTTPTTDLAEKPQTSTPPVAQTSSETSDKLEVAAVPKSQVDEIMQGDGEKVYPMNEIERIRGSIADSSGDIEALKAINADLLRLQNALKKKIEIVRKELEDTDKTIRKMSDEIETNTPVAEKKAPIEDKPELVTDTVKPEPATDIDKPEPVTEAETKKLDTPKEESKEKGVNIAVDSIAVEQINKLESEIAELKSQQETAQIQKYLIIILLLMLLAAAAFVILSSRGQLPRLDQIIQRITRSIKSPAKSDFESSVLLNHIDTRIDPEHLEQPEIPLDDTNDNFQKQEDHYTELLAKLTSQGEGLSALEPTLDSGEESEDDDDTVPASADSSDQHNIDRTLTSVDVYIAYRRFSEAEFVLTKAIDELSDHYSLKAKLLEIYAMKNDAVALSQHLEKFHDQISTEAPELWYKVLHKCARLMPNDPVLKRFIDEAHAIPESNFNQEATISLDDIEFDEDDANDEIDIGDIELSDNEEIDMDLFFKKQKSDNSN